MNKMWEKWKLKKKKQIELLEPKNALSAEAQNVSMIIYIGNSKESTNC